MTDKPKHFAVKIFIDPAKKVEFDRVEVPLVPKSIEISALSYPYDQALQSNQANFKSSITHDLKLAAEQECQIEMPLLHEILGYQSMFAESNFFVYNR